MTAALATAPATATVTVDARVTVRRVDWRRSGWLPSVLRATGVVIPENSIRADSRHEAESAHHSTRCLRSCVCS